MKRITVSSTMGPGPALDQSSLSDPLIAYAWLKDGAGAGSRMPGPGGEVAGCRQRPRMVPAKIQL